MKEFDLDFPRAYGALAANARFREQCEDFQVDEELGFLPVGEGEHVYLHVRKRGENTAWVAEKIAGLAGVSVNDIGYCGRKDRHAVTSQWFSVYLPKGPEPLWNALNSESIQLLSVSRHSQKLRRGDHLQNHFIICLRDMDLDDYNAFTIRLNQVLAKGVPNYFGEQRFGRNGNNLYEAHAILVEEKRFRDKQKRGLMLSAARSYLFNLVLAARVKAGNWCAYLEGETSSYPSGPLWGRGRSKATGELEHLEDAVLSEWKDWCNGLEHAGLVQERRPLLLLPQKPSFSWQDKNLQISFSLAAGEFATSILREIAILHSPYSSPD